MPAGRPITLRQAGRVLDTAKPEIGPGRRGPSRLGKRASLVAKPTRGARLLACSDQPLGSLLSSGLSENHLTRHLGPPANPSTFLIKMLTWDGQSLQIACSLLHRNSWIDYNALKVLKIKRVWLTGRILWITGMNLKGSYLPWIVNSTDLDFEAQHRADCHLQWSNRHHWTIELAKTNILMKISIYWNILPSAGQILEWPFYQATGKRQLFRDRIRVLSLFGHPFAFHPR